jgi:hypothetical protein
VLGVDVAAGPCQGTAAGEVAQHLSARPIHVKAPQRSRCRRRRVPIWSDEAQRWLTELRQRLKATADFEHIWERYLDDGTERSLGGRL